MRVAHLLIGALLSALAFHTADAEIYRCETTRGVSYSDRRCEHGNRGTVRANPYPTIQQVATATRRLQLDLDAYAAKSKTPKASDADSCCCDAAKSVLPEGGK